MIKTIPLVFCMLFLSLPASADNSVHDTQAFVYYSIPLGGSTAEDKAHKFGFRMDQSWIEPDQVIDMNRIMSRSAMLDFRMTSNAQPRLELHGVDYLARYMVNKADEGEAAAGAATTEEAEPAATGTTQEAPAQAEAEQTEEEETLTSGIMDSLSEVPLGIFIGLGVLGAIAAGG
ncbi:MAG: hypothetical protein MI673_03350 [Thiotrichales bacterium]|nr:hypothetical protein [Thiotrichales bacterium]